MTAYYNEIDPYCAQWLRNLIAENLIAPGDVDTRDIRDVRPVDLQPYVQCHFFAGIGGWSRALRLAGVGDDVPVWTGSCPCQPFSTAGRGGGFADERHLWPFWHHLIRVCRPDLVFGEQVASSDGLLWFELVHADLEGEAYAVAAADLCAAGVGAPHIRQRLWFVADSERGAAERRRHDLAATPGGPESEAHERKRVRDDAGAGIESGELADAKLKQWDGNGDEGQRRRQSSIGSELGHPGSEGLARRACQRGDDGAQCETAERAGGSVGAVVDPAREQERFPRRARQSRSALGIWRDADWLPCTDGKARPVEPGTFPLAHGVPARVGRLRAYGNAIVPQVAAEFIKAALTPVVTHAT